MYHEFDGIGIIGGGRGVGHTLPYIQYQGTSLSGVTTLEYRQPVDDTPTNWQISAGEAIESLFGVCLSDNQLKFLPKYEASRTRVTAAPRRSGKTTALFLYAMLLASSDKKVAFVVPNMATYKILLDRTANLPGKIPSIIVAYEGAIDRDLSAFDYIFLDEFDFLPEYFVVGVLALEKNCRVFASSTPKDNIEESFFVKLIRPEEVVCTPKSVDALKKFKEEETEALNLRVFKKSLELAKEPTWLSKS